MVLLHAIFIYKDLQTELFDVLLRNPDQKLILISKKACNQKTQNDYPSICV